MAPFFKKSKLFFFIGLVFLGCTPKHNTVSQLQQITDSLKLVYAPDKRTAVFETVISNKQNKPKVHLITDNPLAQADLYQILTSYYPQVNFTTHLYPDSTLGENHYGIITVSVANIKSKPAHSAELGSQTILGTAVKLLTVNDPWILTQTPDNYLGWIHKSSIQICSKNEVNAWINAPKIIYTNHAGSVFQTPKMLHPMSDITAGSLLQLISETTKCYEVVFPDKRTGFVAKTEAEKFDSWLNNQEFKAANVVNRAMEFLGHPYLWGGTSAKAVDCSGFTKTVYFMNGLILQRDASQQELYGKKISLENNFADLKPGDLLFFGRAKTDSTPKKITHVGIYTGNLHFIHASGRVLHDSFNPEDENYNEYRLKTLVSARRILTGINTPGIEKISDNKFYQTQP